MSSNNLSFNQDSATQPGDMPSQNQEDANLIKDVINSSESKPCSDETSQEASSGTSSDITSSKPASESCGPQPELNGVVQEDATQNVDNIGASVVEENEQNLKNIEQSLSEMVIEEAKSVITQPECSKTGNKSPELQKSSTLDSSVISNKQIYRLKWMEWHNKKIPIVTQNENGPCPLIAIANILLLRGKIHLRNSMELITSSELMDFIGDAIMESIPKDLKGPSMLNYEQNMHDAIAILPQLHTGLDVNIKFTGVQHFEYTPECIIFDLLNIPLYHGWLVDPQCQETVDAVGNCGYNQLVEQIILNKCSSDSDKVTEALIAEQFLERTASQLTYHGLCELNSAMKPEELAVLFRNNHFSTIVKRKSELFQLVTDQGFLHESRVVWETLCNIEGDGQFVDAQFATVPPKSSECYIPDPVLTEEQQINQDYLVALSLQEEQKKQQDREQAWQEYKETLCNSSDLSDEELARRIQEEQQTNANPSRAPSPSMSTSSRMPSPGAERGRKGAMCNVI